MAAYATLSLSAFSYGRTATVAWVANLRFCVCEVMNTLRAERSSCEHGVSSCRRPETASVFDLSTLSHCDGSRRKCTVLSLRKKSLFHRVETKVE